jgi:hypothetical protein
VDDVPDAKAFLVAYEAFDECAGRDFGDLQYSTAWAACIAAVLAFSREMNSRKEK